MTKEIIFLKTPANRVGYPKYISYIYGVNKSIWLELIKNNGYE